MPSRHRRDDVVLRRRHDGHGTAVEHAYAATGTYTVTATSVDALGNARTPLAQDHRWLAEADLQRAPQGSIAQVTCSLGYNPAARVGISGKIYRVKGNRTYGLRRGTVTATTSTGAFTLSYKIRAARKGRYAVVLTIAGQPTRRSSSACSPRLHAWTGSVPPVWGTLR